MYSFFDYFWVRRGEVFFNFTLRRVVRELPKSFLLVEVGTPNDTTPPLSAALIVMSLRFRRFKSADHSSGLRLEDLLSRLNLSLQTLCPHFLEEKCIVANWPSGGVHLDLQLLSFRKTSFSKDFKLLLWWKKTL